MLRSRGSIVPLLTLVAVGAATGCGDSDDNATGPDPLGALAGSYTTQSFVYTAAANAQLTTGNLVTLGIGITSLSVGTDGTFSGAATLPVQGQLQTLQVTGNLSAVTSSSLTINFDPPADQVLTSPLAVAYTVTGNVLSFTATNVNFDYSLVGGPPGSQASTLEVLLLKN